MSVLKTAHEIQRKMRHVRCDMDEQMDELVDNAKQITEQITDWHSYFNANPLLYLGIAAGLGYWVVPTRIRVERPVAESLADLAKTGAIKIEHPAPAQSLWDVARDMGIGMVSSAALKFGMGWLNRELTRLIAPGAVDHRASVGPPKHPAEVPSSDI